MSTHNPHPEVRAKLPPLVMAGLRPGHPASTPYTYCMEGLDGRLKGGHDELGKKHEGTERENTR